MGRSLAVSEIVITALMSQANHGAIYSMNLEYVVPIVLPLTRFVSFMNVFTPSSRLGILPIRCSWWCSVGHERATHVAIDSGLCAICFTPLTRSLMRCKVIHQGVLLIIVIIMLLLLRKEKKKNTMNTMKHYYYHQNNDTNNIKINNFNNRSSSNNTAVHLLTWPSSKCSMKVPCAKLSVWPCKPVQTRLHRKCYVSYVD